MGICTGTAGVSADDDEDEEEASEEETTGAAACTRVGVVAGAAAEDEDDNKRGREEGREDRWRWFGLDRVAGNRGKNDPGAKHSHVQPQLPDCRGRCDRVNAAASR